jgi:hypothetical protein
MDGYCKTSFASKVRGWVHDEGNDEDYYYCQYNVCNTCKYHYHKDVVIQTFGLNNTNERYKTCVKCRAKAKTYRDADNNVEMVDGFVKCGSCKCVYKNIITDFGFDRLGQQYHTCVKCRTKKKERRDKDVETARHYDRMYSNNRKEKREQQITQDEKEQTRLNNINNIKPHISHIESKKGIKLKYCYKGKSYEKTKGYVKIGYEGATEELTEWFREQVELLTKQK